MIEAARVVADIDGRLRLVETRSKILYTIETDAPVNTRGSIEWVEALPFPKPLFFPGSIS